MFGLIPFGDPYALGNFDCFGGGRRFGRFGGFSGFNRGFGCDPFSSYGYGHRRFSPFGFAGASPFGFAGGSAFGRPDFFPEVLGAVTGGSIAGGIARQNGGNPGTAMLGGALGPLMGDNPIENFLGAFVLGGALDFAQGADAKQAFGRTGTAAGIGGLTGTLFGNMFGAGYDFEPWG